MKLLGIYFSILTTLLLTCNSCKKDPSVESRIKGKWNIKSVEVNNKNYNNYLDTLKVEYYVFGITDNQEQPFDVWDSVNSSGFNGYNVAGRWSIGKHDSNTDYLHLRTEIFYIDSNNLLDSNNFLPGTITGDESWIILDLNTNEINLEYNLDTNTYNVNLVRR